MTQEQLDLLVRLVREVVRDELAAQSGRQVCGERVEDTYAYLQAVRHLVDKH